MNVHQILVNMCMLLAMMQSMAILALAPAIGLELIAKRVNLVRLKLLIVVYLYDILIYNFKYGIDISVMDSILQSNSNLK